VFFKTSFEYFIPFFNKKLVFGNNYFFSLLTYDDEPPKLYRTNLGGVIEPGLPNFNSFIGLKQGRVSGENGYKLGVNLQYELFDKSFISAIFDYGNVGDLNKSLFSLNDAIYGYGFSFGYNSVVGPLELIIVNSNISNNPSLYLNLGMWF
jgi:NTE family protein